MRNISPLHFQRSEHDRMFVAAIDFGTHGSGFAVCTRANYKKDCNKIYIHQWKSGTTFTCKAPTTVLMQPGDQHCISFGYEAEEEYLNMNLSKIHLCHPFYKFVLCNQEYSNISYPAYYFASSSYV